MSSISKLAIRGIRSFDDKSISVIEFYSPVTVIVGHNGSGKTTIIECLKYATTGDQPPNTKGGAFIHDPKIANEKEVKAQVKLRFHAANGRRMLAVRNLSVTLKKNNAMAMKTLENILAVADSEQGGKRGVLSTKCAEIDNEVPHLLGVSKAVLENVIFCHQEDSYWPLAEPSILKKKFDDIFESTKYTKALENIKSLRKDRVAELKTDKERLASLELEKGHSDRLNNRIKRLIADVRKKEAEHVVLEEELEQLVEQNRKLAETSSRFRVVFVECKNLEDKRERLENDLKEGLSSLVELAETDEELSDRRQNFDRYCAQTQQRRDRKQKDLARERESQAQDQHDLVQLIERKAKLQAGQTMHERNIEARIELIRSSTSELNIRGFGMTTMDDSQIDEFRGKLRDIRKKRKQTVDEVQREGTAKQDELNSRYRELESNRTGIANRRDLARENLAKAQKQIQEAEANISTSDMVSIELTGLKADREEKHSRLKRSEIDRSKAKYDSRLAEMSSQTSKLEEKREALSSELQYMSAHSESRAKLDLKQDELRRKKLEYNTTLEANRPKIRKLLKRDVDPSSMVAEIEKAYRHQEETCKTLHKESEAIGQNVHHVEQTVSELESKMLSKRKEVKELEKKLKSELQEGETVQEALKAANEEITYLQTEGDALEGTTKVYESFLRYGQTKHVCIACDRPLNASELKKFEIYVKTQITKASEEHKASEYKEELIGWRQELERIQTLLPLEAQYSSLKDKELPDLEKQLKDQKDRLPSFISDYENIAEKLQQANKLLRDLEALKQTAIMISRASSTIEELTYEIAALEQDLSRTGSTRSAVRLKEELDDLSSKLRKIQRDRNNLIEERERHNDSHRQIENELHSMEVREHDLQSKLKERKLLENNIENLQREIDSNCSLVKDLDTKLQEVLTPINELKEEQEALRRSLAMRTDEARELLQSVNQIVDKLDAADRRVEEYAKAKFARQLQDCVSQIESLEAQIEQTNQRMEELRTSIQELDKELSESGTTVANIRENLRIRRLRSDLKDVLANMDALNLEAAGQARQDYERTHKEAKEREVKVQSKCAYIGGEIKSQKEQLQEARKEAKMYEGIYKRYKEQLLRVKMAGMANDDLERYAKALDSAIMKYHSLKMEEVNDTMRHLWNKIYQGTDIDSIKIRSDNEGTGNRRSYNYRVVMMKDQVEMDMRGRCSAGQKMLASIIIRLALSDSFGQNCGILALDEPTNALDVDNIDSLASSLIDIINERKNISNFQLIIITHDENFLQKLAQNSVMEYYWRVSRDPRQKSIIERQRAN